MPNMKNKVEDKFDKVEKKNSHNPKRKGKPFHQRKEADKLKDVPFTNDVAWYSKYPELAKVMARIAFNHRNGDNIEYAISDNIDIRNQDQIISMPYMLTPGKSTDGSSAINVTSYAAWKMLNRRFRGVNKYQQSDFGIIQFGVVDVFASIARAERAYGIQQKYSLNQKNVPYQLMIAMGLDPNGFPDLADFRARLNRMILEAKTLCLVRGYSLLDHILFLESNIFKDQNSFRGQYIVPRKEGYWLFTGTTISTGSALKYVPYTASTRLGIGSVGSYSTVDNLSTAEDILGDIRTQLNALLADDDVDNVCSDILAFYGNKEDDPNLVKLVALPEEYCVEPIKDENFLKQFHNAVFSGKGTLQGAQASGVTGMTMPEIWVHQRDNVIYFGLDVVRGTTTTYTDAQGIIHSVGSTKPETLTKVIIDSDNDNVEPDEVLEITRMTVIGDYKTDGSTNYYAELNFGSIVPVKMYTVWFEHPGRRGTIVSSGGVNALVFANADLFVTALDSLDNGSTEGALLSHCDWHPILYGYISGPSRNSPNGNVWGDINNYVSVDSKLLLPIHDTAMLSEFKNPITDVIVKED